jgi:hypothetical protein
MLMVAILALTVAVITCWRGRLNVAPKITIRPAVMPSPNGFDYFISAANMAKRDADKIIDATVDPYSARRVYSLSEKESLLKRHQSALELIRQGFKCDYLYPRTHNSIASPGYHRPLCIVRALLQLEGQVKLRHNDWNGSLASYLDLIRLGELLPKGGDYLPRHNSLYTTVRGSSGLWSVINHLNASQCKVATKRIEELTSKHWPLSETIQEQKLTVQGTLMEVFKRPNWRGYLIEGYSVGDLRLAMDLALYNPKLAYECMSSGKPEIVDQCNDYLDQWTARVRKPYAALIRKPQDPKNHFSQNMVGCQPSGLFFADTKSQTLSNLLMVALALRAYKLEHGSYPKTLHELVRNYLKKVPADLFAPSGDLRYKVKGKSYVLYSIGPDGKDDGGKPAIDTRWSNPAMKYYVDWCVKGDIVAGVNTK